MRHAARISEPPRPSKRLESLLAEIGATSKSSLPLTSSRANYGVI